MNLFPAPNVTDGVIAPRPYQVEAQEALDAHLRNKDSNPCVVIPTGGGKSIMIAWAIQTWKAAYPPFRVCILAHRRELVEQNADELLAVWPTVDMGINSAGLNRRDLDNAVIYAGIDSVHKKWGEFPPFDCLIIDEAHRIPAKGEGKYRDFIKGCKISNKKLRVVGYTATPFRMGCGPICHKNHILNEVCYEANVGDLINQGYLCRLRSKVGDVQPELDDVKRNTRGDYIVKSLAAAVDTDKIVRDAVRSAMGHINNEDRKSIIFFCVDVHHCRQVSMELRKYGIEAPTVTAQTGDSERTRIAEMFKAGRIRAICNVNVYTEGFNAKCIDCIVLLRPTLSKGLYVQMVGRGLRLHPSKTDTLILDYAHCIDEHGPIDCIEGGLVKLIECGDCGDTFSKAIRICPHCGWEVPKIIIERDEAEEREKKMHEVEASKAAILAREPQVVAINSVDVQRHVKAGSPDSIRVEYRCGMTVYREWICLDHRGYARNKARAWWHARFGKKEAATVTVETALEDMFLGDRIRSVTAAIVVVQKGKHSEIIDYQLRSLAQVNQMVDS